MKNQASSLITGIIIEDRAEKLAKERLSINSQNMFLEAQVISSKKEKFLINELKQDLLKAGGRVLWKNKKGAENS